MPLPAAQSYSPWSPLLDESQAQAARVTIFEIADTLKAEVETIRQKCAQPQESYSPSFELGEGAAGLAVFFAYLHRAGLLADARESAFAYLNTAIDAMASRAMNPSLYSGFTGIGWAARHVMEMLGESSSDLTEELDLAVEQYVSHSPWKEDYDLISGLVGYGVYCLEQDGSQPAQRALAHIVERLYELAERSDHEACWFTRPELLVEQQRQLYPNGYYNLGLAHGIPGVIALLARTYRAGIAHEKSLWLLERSVPWLLNRRLTGMNSSFSGFFLPDRKSEDCRLAWCYGDAGIAAALLQAARCTGMKSWEEEALAIARKAALRKHETCGVRDVCFCHGAAGLTHVFNRLYQATRESVFAGAARHWLDATLQYRKPGIGVAGYSVFSANDKLEAELMGRLGLIEGVAGVALSLLAAITEVEPCWDRMFQVDIPPLPLSTG